MLVMLGNRNTREMRQSDRDNYNFWEDQKIKDILGHPVKRVIYDKQGNIILDIGDIITFRALEQVNLANELDYLFTSVYRK